MAVSLEIYCTHGAWTEWPTQRMFAAYVWRVHMAGSSASGVTDRRDAGNVLDEAFQKLRLVRWIFVVDWVEVVKANNQRIIEIAQLQHNRLLIIMRTF